MLLYSWRRVAAPLKTWSKARAFALEARQLSDPAMRVW